MKYLIATVIALISLSINAMAGSPVDREMTCPVGGEKFTITSTNSCSSFDRTMSFRPITSCEFVTRLPVCPSNGLPMYKEFSPAEVAQLDAFVQTPEYSELRQLTPWQRAYQISRFLGQSDTKKAFGLLVSAMWYEPNAFFSSPAMINGFLTGLDGELARLPADKRPYLNALAAYALSKAGRLAAANARLTAAKQAPGIPDYMKDYIAAVEACQSNMNSKSCSPNARFVDNKRKAKLLERQRARLRREQNKSPKSLWIEGNIQSNIKNYQRAVQLWQRAADGGQPSAMYRLGIAYELGKGVTRDLDKALHYYRQGAAHGHRAARCRKGLLEAGKAAPPNSKSVSCYPN